MTAALAAPAGLGGRAQVLLGTLRELDYYTGELAFAEYASAGKSHHSKTLLKAQYVL